MNWINIEQQKPADFKEVLFGNKDNEVAEGFYANGQFTLYRANFDESSITHYMEFDDLPTVPIV